MLFFRRLQGVVERAAKLGQALRKSLPGTADFLFTPALSLANHRVHALFDSYELLIAFGYQLLGLSLSAIAGSLYSFSQTLASVCQILLNLLKLTGALPPCNRPKPEQYGSCKKSANDKTSGHPNPQLPVKQ